MSSGCTVIPHGTLDTSWASLSVNILHVSINLPLILLYANIAYGNSLKVLNLPTLAYRLLHTD